MDTKTKSHLTPQTIPPAQLWIGPHEVLVNEVQTFLQTFFCTHNSCTICSTCTHIAQQQHHAIMWLYPEKQYTITTMQGLFSAIAFSLHSDERFFFVIQKADFLTPACANKLLKPMEEPPPGYHFLLLAQSSSQILPTIRSRCVTTSFYTTHTNTVDQALFDCFTNHTKTSPSMFLKTLDQSGINERESRELLDALLHYWINRYKDNHESEHTLYIITTLKNASTQPPMPGSSKIFWKNLFLQMHTKQ